MSRFGLISDTGPVTAPSPPDSADADRRWSAPRLRRLPLPLIGTLIYAGIRLVGLAITAFALRQGKFRKRNWSLARWAGSADGGHYRTIAVHGYGPGGAELAHASSFAWFPGYPAAIDSLAWLPGVTVVAAGLIVTAIAGLAAAWGITTLGVKITADPRISLLMVALWALAPGSMVLSMVYAEALFCALAVWALVALLDRRWLTAAVLTLLAGTVRSTAVALIAALAIAALVTLFRAVRERQPVASWWRPLAALALAPLGLIGYLAYVAVATHRLDGWFWVENQRWHMSFDWGVSTLRLVKSVFLDGPSVAQLLIVLAIIAAAGLALWSLTERLPGYLHVYTIVVVFVALTTSANWVSSKPRFLLPAFLLALPAARLLAPVRTWVLVPLFGVLIVVSTWFGLYLLVTVGWAP
jgi:Gpi18-like mannosyltransferase